MKKLILLIPAFMLIGCGEFQTQHDTTAQKVVDNLDGNLTEEDQQMAQSIPQDVLNQQLTVIEHEGENSVTLEIAGVQTKIDFLDDPNIAFLMNGIEVSHEIASDPQSLQAMLMSLVSSQLGGVKILGLDAMSLVNMGMQLFSGGDSWQTGLSSVLSVVTRGLLNAFLSSVPFGGLVVPILGPIIDNILGNVIGGGDSGSSSTGNTNSGTTNDSSSSGSLVNGIFSFITNLFKN
ncbi:MAG: hypothetical protein KDD33_10870 [Bdellovibrionales bacterium]|nr:hypothetical protein [Bdellovibrionales bacterium]